MNRSLLPEIAASILLALLAAAATLAYRPYPIYDDGIVYLNIAENLRQGHGVSTTIVHYDTERSHGRIPAPVTTFPPGYPAVIALFGGSETAARLVSIAGFAATAGLLTWGLLAAAVPFIVRLAALALLLTNVFALSYSTSVTSEWLFTSFAFSSLLGILWTFRSGRATGVVLACVSIGLAYTVRYAALFLMPPVIGYTLYRAYSDRRWQLSLAALIPASIAISLIVRNALLVGDWRGGNDLVILNPISQIIGTYVRGELHLIFGNHKGRWGAWELLTLAAAATTAIGAWLHSAGKTFREEGLAGLWIALYTAAFFYAARHSVVDLDSRMFLPMLPCYLLALGLIVSPRLVFSSKLVLTRASVSVLFGLALVTLALGYAAINARDIYEADPPPRQTAIAAMLAEPTSSGQPLRQWLESNLSPGDVIVASDGQATAYVLHRPTLSMVTAVYSNIHWECGEIQSQMARYRSRYLILFKPPPAGSPESLTAFPIESKFVASSSEQQQSCGFTVPTENRLVRVLRRTKPD